MYIHIWVLLLQVLGCLDPIGVVIVDPCSAGRITYAAPDSPSAHGWDAQPRTTRLVVESSPLDDLFQDSSLNVVAKGVRIHARGGFYLNK